MDYLYGRKRFQEVTKCETFEFSGFLDYDIYSLFDHGFIATAACVWGKPELEGHEIAIVSRTYVGEETINNPPDGLRCIKIQNPLKEKVFGKKDIGELIATVICDVGYGADVFLLACQGIPAYLFAATIPIDMPNGNFVIAMNHTGIDFQASVIKY